MSCQVLRLHQFDLTGKYSEATFPADIPELQKMLGMKQLAAPQRHQDAPSTLNCGG